LDRQGRISLCIAIGHKEDDAVIIDAVRERKPPFAPAAVVEEFSELLKAYRIDKVTGDRFAGEWPRERFREHGIEYEPSAAPKNDLYRDLLPVLNSRKSDLLDNDRLVAQFVGLERRTARSGRDSIDHAPGAHDDLVNAIAGVCVLVTKRGTFDSSYAWAVVGAPESDKQTGQKSLWQHPALGGGILYSGY
jgi:hypothetical protein